MTPAKAIAAPGAASSLPKWMLNLPMETLGGLVVPLAVLAIVIALITPLPGFVLDLLIVTDILVSVIVLMVALYLIRPVEFTSFPTTLLLLTLFRLALNISSSRLILINGNTGTSAAGEVIGLPRHTAGKGKTSVDISNSCPNFAASFSMRLSARAGRPCSAHRASPGEPLTCDICACVVISRETCLCGPVRQSRNHDGLCVAASDRRCCQGAPH